LEDLEMKRKVTRVVPLMMLIAIGVVTAAIPVERTEAQPATGAYYVVNLKASNGQYVVAEYGGGREVKADRNAAGDWERFVVFDVNGGELVSGDKVRVRAQNGKFVCAEQGQIKANRDVGSTWETFTITKLPRAITENTRLSTPVVLSNDKITLRAWDNRYVCAERGGGREVKADRPKAGDWETFTITLRSRHTTDPSPLGTTYAPAAPPTPAAPPPPPLPPDGYTLLGSPECNPQVHLTASLASDAAGYFCCELKIGANSARCGADHLEFQPDCMNFSPHGMLLQPYGCVRRTP
jgi:hypothetical protein